MSVMHNGRFDGKNRVGVYSFLDLWYKNNGSDNFPIAREMCEPYLTFGG